MHKAVKNYSGYDAAYSNLGEWYFEDHQYAAAADVFTKAAAGCANGNKQFALPLAKSLLFSGNIPGALQIISAYAPGSKNLAEWNKLRSQAQFMQQAMNHQLKDTVFNMGCRINTRYAEMYPCITADEQSIFYTRRTNGIDEDFYRSDVDSCGGWFSGKSLGYPINTLSQEASQMVSADRHYLFFMRCDNRSPNGWDKGGCDLYMAYTADSVWSVPESFGATINTPSYEGMPCLSSDNKELFFVSDRPGGYGGLDIWSSRFEHGLWQEPHNLGPEVNTSGNEIAPFLCSDNKTLFFASDGHIGMGGSDLFRTSRTDDTTWAGAENLGYPINTVYDEISLSLNIDGTKAFITSNRDSSAGNFDLYEMKWPKQWQPQPVSFVKGYVYDSIGKERLNYAGIFISDAETGKELYQYSSNRGDGSYMFVLPAGRRYALYVDRIGFQHTEDTITITDASLREPLVHNLTMLPSGYEKPVTDSIVMTLYFKKNVTALSDSEKNSITDVLKVWLPQKNVQLFVNGYTDNSGTPILNEQLSYQRANAVAGQLTAIGFDPGIVATQGWGEANPVAGNDTDEDRDKNRRVEIVIRK
ncbi:OmpA family protein [Chitinophagaceae bacterium MMS25-I14]